jgi:hypothetical protein
MDPGARDYLRPRCAHLYPQVRVPAGAPGAASSLEELDNDLDQKPPAMDRPPDNTLRRPGIPVGRRNLAKQQGRSTSRALALPLCLSLPCVPQWSAFTCLPMLQQPEMGSVSDQVPRMLCSCLPRSAIQRRPKRLFEPRHSAWRSHSLATGSPLAHVSSPPARPSRVLMTWSGDAADLKTALTSLERSGTA